MQTLDFTQNKLSLQNKPTPTPADGQALIKITRAGVCRTDIEITKGYFGFEGTLGHEFVGVVEQCGDSEWIGQRVVCDINCACGTCPTCQKGDPHHCPNRDTIGILKKDGAFAEYINAPVSNLIKVPDHVTDDQAVFAEPLAAALEIQEQVDLNPSEPICVLGDGKLGLLIAMSLAASDFKVTLVGRHPDRKSKLGDLPLEYTTDLPTSQFTTVIEATGNEDGFKAAVDLTKPRGTLVLKSTYAGGFEFNPVMVVVNEIKIQGSRCGPFDKAVELLASGKLDPSPLIDQTYSLADGIKAMEHAVSKGALKVLITP